MTIPRDFIDDLLARTDIVELIDQRVPLKKTGKNLSACCPFHNEKTPSFTVSHDKQFYHCFGCGAHGNAIDFVMAFDRMEFVDAMEHLAHAQGLTVPRQSHHTHGQRGHTKNLYERMAEVVAYYQQQLWQHNARGQAITYLKQRGLSPEIVRRYGLGLALPGWRHLTQAFAAHQSDMIQVGVVVQSDEGRCYDRFRNRLIFPIRDRMGRYVGLGGRVFDDSKPKYLNSPETPLFHKGKELYGLYELKQACREIPYILMVEGYMDVVSLAQFEVPYAVASLGTATTSEQIQLLFRHTKQVIFCYDGDQAGKTAAWRSLTTALPHLKAGQMLKFMFLPDQHDPDSYVRQHGKVMFEEQIKAALTLSDFLIATLKREHPEDKAAFVQQSITLIEQAHDEILQETLWDQLAYEVRLNSAAELKKKFNLTERGSSSAVRAQNTDRQHYTMRLAIALLLQTPTLGFQLPQQTVLTHLNIRGGSLLAKLLDLTRERHLNTGQLIEHFRDQPKIRQILIALSKWHTGVELEFVACEFKSSLIWLNNKYLDQQFNELNQKKHLTPAERQQLQALVQALQGA